MDQPCQLVSPSGSLEFRRVIYADWDGWADEMDGEGGMGWDGMGWDGVKRVPDVAKYAIRLASEKGT